MSALPVAASYWEGVSYLERQASLSLLAYAAGDAYGFQCEFSPNKIESAPLDIGAKPNWPIGAVSDDTLLTRLTILALGESDPATARKKFLESLRVELPNLRGLGPTTRAALGMEIREVELPQVGISNGGMMRTAICGFAFENSHERAEWISALASATHSQSIARDCAIGLAEAYGNHDLTAQEAILSCQLEAEILEKVSNLETWSPPETGISNSAIETLLAVLYVHETATSLLDVYHRSVLLGGDSDTVAALSAGLYAIRKPSIHELFSIPWINQVDWSDLTDLAAVIKVLLARRSHGG